MAPLDHLGPFHNYLPKLVSYFEDVCIVRSHSKGCGGHGQKIIKRQWQYAESLKKRIQTVYLSVRHL